MKYPILSIALASLLLAGCGSRNSEAGGASAAPASPTAEEARLKIIELKAGQGPAIASGQAAAVHYTGWLFDANAPDNKGTKFDSSLDRGQPFVFQLGAGQVIPGWDEGVAGMSMGQQRRLVIPPGMGYGASGAGGVIPPNATLVFDVELLGIQ